MRHSSSCGEAVADPVGREAELEGDAAGRETSRHRVVGDGAAPMEVLDDAEHRAQPDVVLRPRRPADPVTTTASRTGRRGAVKTRTRSPRQPVAVEPLEDAASDRPRRGGRRGPRPPGAVAHTLARATRVVRRDEDAVDAVVHQFGDAGDVGGDHRRGARHGLDEHVGDAVAVAVVHHPAGQAEHRSPAGTRRRAAGA